MGPPSFGRDEKKGYYFDCRELGKLWTWYGEKGPTPKFNSDDPKSAFPSIQFGWEPTKRLGTGVYQNLKGKGGGKKGRMDNKIMVYWMRSASLLRKPSESRTR